MTDNTALERNPYIDSQDDVDAWVVLDEDLPDNPDLEGVIYCVHCIDFYLGGGAVLAQAEEQIADGVECHRCEVRL